MLVVELFFGRANVSDAAWQQFATQTLTVRFPDGFSTWDAAGQWRAAPDKPISREASKLVIIAADDSATSRARLEAVMADYRTRFNQQSVGIVLNRACAAF